MNLEARCSHTLVEEGAFPEVRSRAFGCSSREGFPECPGLGIVSRSSLPTFCDRGRPNPPCCCSRSDQGYRSRLRCSTGVARLGLHKMRQAVITFLAIHSSISPGGSQQENLSASIGHTSLPAIHRQVLECLLRTAPTRSKLSLSAPTSAREDGAYYFLCSKTGW
jgi:hypothetical protein